MSNLDLLDKAFRDHFPIRSDDTNAELDYLSVQATGDARYGVVIRLIVWDVNETTRVQSIRDVKEQEVDLKLATLDLATIVRVRELVAAMARVLPKVLMHREIESLMPHDLIDFGPLKLASAKTEDDFVKAYSAPSRLGRYLPSSPT